MIDLQTLRGKTKVTEKMMLKRVKTEVEKKVKIKMIRNLAPQSALEPQNQVAEQLPHRLSLCALLLAGVIC